MQQHNRIIANFAQSKRFLRILGYDAYFCCSSPLVREYVADNDVCNVRETNASFSKRIVNFEMVCANVYGRGTYHVLVEK